MYFYDDPEDKDPSTLVNPEGEGVSEELDADGVLEEVADIDGEAEATDESEQKTQQETTKDSTEDDEVRKRIQEEIKKKYEDKRKAEETNGQKGTEQKNQQTNQNHQENSTNNTNATQDGTGGKNLDQSSVQGNQNANLNPSNGTPNLTQQPPANANLANNATQVANTAQTTSTATSTIVAGGETAAGSATAAGGAAAGLGPVLLIILLVILAIIVIIGVIMFFLAMPGQVSGKLKKLGVKFLDVCQALIHGKENVIHTEDLADVANYLESMGYDLKGEGFVSAEMGSTSKTYRDKEGNEIVAFYDDEQDVWRSEDGKVVDITSDPIMTYLVSDNLAYIIKNFNSNLDTMTGGHGEEAFVIITTLVATFLSLVIFSPIALIAGTIAIVGGGSTLLFALTGNPNWGTGLISIWHEGSDIGVRR